LNKHTAHAIRRIARDARAEPHATLCGEAEDGGERWGGFSSFEAALVGAVEAGGGCELFLGEAGGFAEVADAVAELCGEFGVAGGSSHLGKGVGWQPTGRQPTGSFSWWV
jgi:hypothetical protein